MGDKYIFLAHKISIMMRPLTICFRHLRTMRPLLKDKEYDELVELTAEFETSIASRLQRYLWLKWIWSDNYVSDWWEEYVYLSSRTPLMINSNYIASD